MKKTLLSLTAGVVIASTYATTVEAASYTVQKGDSLWTIAHKHQTSVSHLKSINNLKNDIIFPTQVLKLDQPTVKKETTPKKEDVKTETKQATTYTVKSGDSLSKIANNHNISLTDLMEWNKLTTTLIYPGDVLTVSNSGTTTKTVTPPKEQVASETPAPTANTSKPASNSSNTSTYTVKSGDSLWKIGNSLGVSVNDLKKWNNLSSDMIRIGQVLQLQSVQKAASTPAVEETTTKVEVDYDVTKLIDAAKEYLGTSYLFGGSNPGTGFDCSGFVYHVYNKAGKSMGRYSSDGYYNRSFYVNKPQVGDLVFFENTYRQGISHLGIFIGNNSFIHAGSKGVEISSLTNAYWKEHFEGFKRLY